MSLRKRVASQSEQVVVHRPSFELWITMLILCVFGLLMIASASAYECSTTGNFDPLRLVKKQAVFMLAGIVVCAGVHFIDYQLLKRLYLPLLVYFFGIGLILLLKTPLGVDSNGAIRWIKIAGIQFQVAEVVKVCLIITLSAFMERFQNLRDKIQVTLYAWVLGGIYAIGIWSISNDLSSAVVIIGITYFITFVCTRTFGLHVIVLLVGAAAVFLWVQGIWNDMPTVDEIANIPFRNSRIAIWLDPERYIDSKGAQTSHALYAIGRGGWFGKGIGKSIQKISNLPEAQNDMIFAVLCEELGIFGASLVIILYVYMLSLFYKIIKNANDVFGVSLVVGVMAHIGVQAFFNIAVSMNLLPNTGIGLPFISSGGSSVLFLMCEMAIVFSVELQSYRRMVRRQERKMMRE